MPIFPADNISNGSEYFKEVTSNIYLKFLVSSSLMYIRCRKRSSDCKTVRRVQTDVLVYSVGFIDFIVQADIVQ